MNQPTAKPVLYTFRRCPYAMRARLAILSSGQQVEIREISLKSKPAELVTVSAKATTPTLVLPDGTVVAESLDIMRWALSINDPQQLLNYPAELDDLISHNDGDFKHALDRYKYITRYPEDADHDWRAKGEKFLVKLEDKLSSSPYLAGEQPTLLDYAIFPFIRQFRMPDKDWFDNEAPYPHLRTWLNKHVESIEFKAIMEKFPLWESGSTPINWPA